MMKRNLRHKIINLFLILILFSHLAFIHDIIKNYVLCYGSDGHIVIEKVNECVECPELNDFIELGYPSINCVNCEDVSLDQSCIAEGQFLTKNKDVVSTEKIKTSVNILKPDNRLNKILALNLHQNINPILQSYSTVSLLI